LLANYSQIHDALHEVVLSSNGKSSSEAMSFIHSTTQFSFIVCTTISQYLLAIIRPLTVLLQKINIDLLTARKEAQVTLDTIQSIRNNDTFVIIYRRATGIAASLEVEPSLPRTAGKQKHRANAPSKTPEEYYRKNIYLPFVDHIIQHLATRFPEMMDDVYRSSLLNIPSNLLQLTDADIDGMIRAFSDDINEDQFRLEVW
jgi:hypothetical protein